MKGTQMTEEGVTENGVKAEEHIATRGGEDNLLDIEGVDVSAGIENCGTQELYTALLGDFYKLIDKKCTKIEKCMADGMVRDVTIEVHALKSTARMIGALSLSEEFYGLELLGKKEAVEELGERLPAVLAHYREYKNYLKRFAKADMENKREVGNEQIVQTLRQLNDAMEDFDLDSADAAMKELNGYKVSDEIQEAVEELDTLVADVAMEDVMQLCERLIGELEK